LITSVSVSWAAGPTRGAGENASEIEPLLDPTERLWAEYEAFSKRDLSEHAIAYLYVDGIAERLRPGQKREAVLAARDIGAVASDRASAGERHPRRLRRDRAERARLL
jgi:hypothetical protein